jgi:hypothetical protein
METANQKDQLSPRLFYYHGAVFDTQSFLDFHLGHREANSGLWFRIIPESVSDI